MASMIRRVAKNVEKETRKQKIMVEGEKWKKKNAARE